MVILNPLRSKTVAAVFIFLIRNFHRKNTHISQKESLPVWTQEAYHSACNKSLAWGGGYLPWGIPYPLPSPSQDRYPLPLFLAGGYLPWSRGCTYLGVPPFPVLIWLGWGVPTLAGRVPTLGCPSCPFPHPGQGGRVYLPWTGEYLPWGTPPGPGEGRYPLPGCELTNKV